jgi:hypothetical protein
MLNLLICPKHEHCTSSYHIKKETTVLCLLFCYKNRRIICGVNCYTIVVKCGVGSILVGRGSANSASVCYI